MLTDNELQIREFQLTDYDAVLGLWQTAGLPSRPSDTREEIAKKLERDPDLFLIARKDSRLVGTVIGGWDGRRGWVYRVAVHPANHRHGVGRALMEELETRFRAKGALAINLIYEAGNGRARVFYQSLGYQDRSEVRVLGKKLPAGG